MRVQPIHSAVVICALLAACASSRPVPVPSELPPAAVYPPQTPLFEKQSQETPQDPAGVEFKQLLSLMKSGENTVALLAAQEMRERYAGTKWSRRALFVREQVLIQADRPEEAAAAMLNIQAEYPEMGDYGLLAYADYLFSKSAFSEAAALYQQLGERYPASILRSKAEARTAAALMELFDYAKAGEAYDTFLQKYLRSEYVPDAMLGRGKAFWYEARLSEAVRAYQQVRIAFPGSQAETDANRALAELKASGVEVPDLTADEWYERGRNLFRLSQFEQAAASFRKLLDREPASPNRSDALFRIGICLFNLGKRGEAAVVLEKMLHDYPSDPRTDEALYWTGRAYSKLGDWDRSMKTFRKLLDRFPDSEWADDALFLTGNIYRELNDQKQALAFYSRLVRDYPDSKYADSALWWKAWSFYTSRDFRKAEAGFQELIERYPKSFLANQALYWQARTAEVRGDARRASAIYSRLLAKGPYTYYGHRAAERKRLLKASGPTDNAGTAPEQAVACTVSCGDDVPAAEDAVPAWDEETKELLASDGSFKKTLELMHLEMKKDAAAELALLQDRVSRKRGMLIGLSKAFFELGDYNRSLLLVLRNYERYLEAPRDGVAGDLWLLAYPQGFWDSIVTWSRKYGQDPFFIAAIIREESQFSTDALSAAGARGLMQVMPSTGEWAARTIGLPSFDAGKLFESDTGINIGTWYISQLMKRFKGDPLLVAAAYNAGPDPVTGWIGRNGYGSERDAFVESIPYAETRGYVKKVLRNYAEYRRIYGTGSVASGDQASAR